MVSRNLKIARRNIVKELGKETVRALHKPNRVADVAALLTVPTLFFANAFALATIELLSPLWIALFIAQGFVLPWFQFVQHDLLLHRKIGGKYNNVLGFLYLLPMMHSFTWFRLYHEQHHDWVGTEKDSEAYKQDLDERWKKVFFLSFVGVKLAMARRLKPAHGDIGATISPNERELVLIKREKWLIRAFFVALIASCFVWQGVLYGYVLPLLIVVPFVSGFRVIMEHAEANRENLYHTGVYYRTGPILDFLYLSHLGDSHFVHHWFQAVPFYRCKRVADMLHPMMLREGVIERRSVLGILKGWFIDNQKHRQLWWPEQHATSAVAPTIQSPVAPPMQPAVAQAALNVAAQSTVSVANR